jgi:uncharacterized OB-fold protein
MIGVTDARPWDRPVPSGEGDYGRFFQACCEGKLLIQECPACGQRQFYPRALCTACGATPGWLETAGRGTIYTFTVVRQNRIAPFAAELPYVVAMIDLEEGVRMLGTVTTAYPDDIGVGLPVEAYARVYEDGRAIPYWRPLEAARHS